MKSFVIACTVVVGASAAGGLAPSDTGGVGNIARMARDTTLITRRVAVDTLATDGWPGTYGSVTRDGRLMSGVDTDDGNLIVRNVRTGTRRTLTDFAKWTDNVGHNVISPDGSVVAFVVNTDNNALSAHSEVRTIASDGTGARTVIRTADPSEYFRVAGWTPDNRFLIALVTRRDQSHEIASIPVDGTRLQVIKSLAWRSPNALAVSPDGRAVAYDAPLSQDNTARELFLLQRDGARETRITSDGMPKSLIGFSGDGTQLFYTTRSEGAIALWRAPIRDGRPNGVPQKVRADLWGAEAIGIGGGAFYYAVTSRRDTHFNVVLDPESGRALGAPTPAPGIGVFSPDGSQLANVGVSYVAGPSAELFTIRDIATGKVRRIGTTLEYLHVTRWDRDGRGLLSIARRKGQLGLYHVDLSTGDARLIDPDADGFVQFSPDGRVMYLRQNVGQVRAAGPLGGVGIADRPTRIVARNLETRQEQELYRGAPATFMLSPDGRTFVLSGTALPDSALTRVAQRLTSFTGREAPRVLRWIVPASWDINPGKARWTPNGKFVVWVHQEEARSEIRIATPGASEFRTLLVVPGRVRVDMQISPDGRRLLYTVASSEKTSEVWLMERIEGAAAQERDALPLGLDLYVPLPDDSASSPGRVALGERLFFDPLLSDDRSTSCASCHRPSLAFSDTTSLSRGVHGRTGTRNAPSILNAAYRDSFFWDGRVTSLERGVLLPIQDSVEMHLPLEELEARLRASGVYRRGFVDAFSSAPTASNAARALAAYVRSLRSGNAPVDRDRFGDPSALSSQARQGMDLFMGKARCAACHLGPLFSDGEFHNTGIASRPGAVSDAGRAAVTGRRQDIGSFRTASLRNVARTAPYMHDGSIGTLEQVLDFYDRGGLVNPNLDERIRPIGLSPSEKGAVVAFLRSLTGSQPPVTQQSTKE